VKFWTAGQSHGGSGRPAGGRQFRPRGGASGASTGAHEAVELRDGGKRMAARAWKGRRQRQWRDIRRFVRHGAEDQIKIDRSMISLDGTPTRRGWAPTPSWA